ncbi:MAG: hypothetical protein JSU77_01345 [Fidelibacterota bacterium]|nr:MAG: hypothetical protein JSU77_01345 [Candidatus Neomarinimicrobiota bacterium]
MRYVCLAALLGIVWTCDKSDDEQPNWGSLDFSTIVALGNSLTAGVSDAALYEDAQKNSYPRLIAKKANVAGDFEQPIISDNGFSWSDKDGRITINPISYEISFLEPGEAVNSDLNRPYNNLGIPMITSGELLTATNTNDVNANHFIDLVLRGSGKTALEEALALDPTIITLWIGNNDVLGAASLGMASSQQPYTSVDDFAANMEAIISTLTQGTPAPIFVANIMDITSLPYFTTLPSSVVDTTDGSRYYLYGVCENGVRKLTDDDLVLYWALPDYFIAQLFVGLGIFPSEATALNDTLVLDATERFEIQGLIDGYNMIIDELVDDNDQVYLVDMHSRYTEMVTTGYQLDGVTYIPDLVIFDDGGGFQLNATRTLFSFDGLHPNRYGYAAVADLFINAMNLAGEAELPMVYLEDLFD